MINNKIDLNKVFYKDLLLKDCRSLDFYDNENCKEAILVIIMDSAYGTHIPQNVCEMFGLDECQDETSDTYWDDFQDVENKLNNIINDFIQYKNYHFYFGYEDNGAYCLFASKDN